MSTALQPVGKQSISQAAQDRQVDAISRVLQQQTPKEVIRWRPGKGGRQLPYTDHVYVTRTLNDAFGWRWSFEVDHEQVHEVNGKLFEATCRGKLTVWLPGIDEPIVKMQMGCQPIEMLKDGITPVSIGDAMKGAGSDALKKCASQLGIALDLYDSDHDPRTNPTEEQLRAQAGEPRTAEQLAVDAQRPAATFDKVSQVITILHEDFGIDYAEIRTKMMNLVGVQARADLDEEKASKVIFSFNKWIDELQARKERARANETDKPF